MNKFRVWFLAKCVWFLASVGRKRDAGEKEKDSDEIKLVTKLIPIFFFTFFLMKSILIIGLKELIKVFIICTRK